MKFALGEVNFASARIVRYTMVGEPLLEPSGTAWAGDGISGLLAAIRQRLGRREAVFFEGLPTDGPTYREIATNEDVQRQFLVLQLGAPYEHQFIKLPGTYHEYLEQLGGRSRQSVQYSERKLDRDMSGQVRSVCFEHAHSIDTFLTDASAISRKTYQWRLLGLGLRDSDWTRRRLTLAAERGWFRSYILYCKDAPVAFLLGYQYRGCYYYTDVGYDPEYADWSVGTVLQIKMLKDLYSRPDRPSLFDFSTGYGSHKARFANVSRQEVHLLLLPRTIANRLLAATYVSAERISAGLVSFLDRLGVKNRVKKLVRRLSIR
ncbi:MAG: GNAT family N-acetyltransferase [Gammaproteobacteria bacterium]